MTRLVVLTRDPEHITAIGQQLASVGGVIANLADSVVTVIMPMLGPVVVNCVVGDEWIDRLSRYGDAVGVAIMAGAGETSYLAALEPLTITAKRAFGNLPIAVGIPVEPNDALSEWMGGALDRPPEQIPIYRVKPKSQEGILILLATLMAMAHESVPPQ